jgi:hypothetical protein
VDPGSWATTRRFTPTTPNSRRLTLLVAVLASALTHFAAFAERTIAQSEPVSARAYRDVEPSHRPLAGADFFGINSIYLGAVTGPEAPAARIATRAVGGIGVGQARYTPAWAEIEPHPPRFNAETHSYNWDYTDARVVILAQHGLRFYPVLAYGTRWATTDDPLSPGTWLAPPTDAHLDDFAAYSAALAGRYGEGGSFWKSHPELPYLPATTFEIWNEPNLGRFWADDPDPAYYARLFLTTRRALGRAQPHARIVTGGLTPIGAIGYVDGMLAAEPEIKGVLTHVGFHLYGDDFKHATRRLRGFRHALDQLGLGDVKIEVTEDGMATTSDPVRATYLRRMAAAVPRSGCRISHYSVHTWITAEQNAADPEDWYGIGNLDGTLKPSGRSFSRAVLRARGLARSAPPTVAPICRR